MLTDEDITMCTRYYVSNISEELKSIIEAAKSSPLAQRFAITCSTPMKTEGEIKPTDVAPVIAPDPSGKMAVYPMRWGYSNVHKGGKLILNARCETAVEKITFKDDWIRHRCIIPALYYFEWEHIIRSDGKIETGERYIIQPQNSSVTWLCGLYHIEDSFPTFVVLTREPGENIRFIHDRMPLILPQNLIPDWITPGSKPEEIMKEALTDMVAEKG